MASANGEYDRKTEAEIQKMIQDRRVKIQEVKRSVELSKKDADPEMEDSVHVFTSLISCIQRKQSFSSGRFYYEVQVGGKTDWLIGLVRESIDRKGQIPGIVYSICLRDGKEYVAYGGSSVPVRDKVQKVGVFVDVPVRDKVQKVGVFVDYEEGLVSFYDVENSVHLYSVTGCCFSERLYPYFGRVWTPAPLIISPVNHSNGGHGL